MAFFTRNGTSSVPEIPAASTAAANKNPSNDKETNEDEAKKFSYLLERDGVEV